MNDKKGKVTIAGAGSIGSTAAYGMLLRNSASQIVLVNRNEEKARVKAFDMSHCIPSLQEISIMGGGLQASAESDVLILAVGILPKKDGNRMDVLARNLEIYRDIVPRLAKLSPNATIVAVTNPVDLMALAAYSFSNFLDYRVLGTGTLLDTLRFKTFIGRVLGLPSAAVEATIAGEHGESMVPIWSKTRIFGTELKKYVKDKGIHWDKMIEEGIMRRTRRAGWDIRLGNEHSSYAIAFSLALITESILGKENNFLPVSVRLKGEYGQEGIFMSLPSRLGFEGVIEKNSMDLYGEEREMMERSAEKIFTNANKIKKYF